MSEKLQEVIDIVSVDSNNGTLKNIATEILRDQLIDIVRKSNLNTAKVIEKFINNNALNDVFSFIEKNKSCKTFDLIDSLDYEPKEICDVLDFLELMGKIKVE